jgi:hypothetical protein
MQRKSSQCGLIIGVGDADGKEDIFVASDFAGFVFGKWRSKELFLE